MAETRLSASQIIITASDIGAAGACETMPEPTSSNVGQIVQYTGAGTTGEITVVSGIVYGTYFAEGDDYNITIDFNKDTFNSYNEYTQTHPITSNPNVSLDIVYAGNPEKGYLTVTYNTDNVLEVEVGLNGGISTAMTKAVMASVGFGVANDEEPFDFYGEEPIELVLPTTEDETVAYTNGYFYKCTETWGFVGPVPDATGEPGESMVFALDYDAFAAYLQTKSIVLAGQTTFYLGGESDTETGDSIYVLQDADYVTIEEFSSLVDMESTTGITWGGQEDLTGDFPYLAENFTGFIVGPTYAWNQIDVQPAGSSLPDQTGQSGKFLTTDGTDASWATVNALPSQSGNSGKFLTTDGTDASWSDKPLVNTATGTNAIGIGEGTTATGNYSIGCGYYSKANGTRSIAIGYGCETTATGGIIISPVNHKQNQPNLIIGRCNDYIAQDCIVLNSIDNYLGMTPSQGDFVVKNSNNAARVLMSADGTIPTDRFTGNNTTPVNAGQYMLTITKDSNGNITRSWEPVVAPSTPATTPVLQGTSTYWIEDQVTHIISQTITVQGVTASNTIFVAPAPVSSADYAAAGIICTAQNTNQLTFTCTTIPTNDIEVNIVIL